MRHSRSEREAAAPPRSERLSDDHYKVVTELSRMADRVIQSREELGAARARAERAERELAAMNERIIAARALVHEAQRRAQVASDRCAWLEGRCDGLERALDEALTATLLKRWKWRRAMRRAD